jgi:hypothetical protein
MVKALLERLIINQPVKKKPLHLCTRNGNSNEHKENLLPYVVANFVWAYVAKIMNVYSLHGIAQQFIPRGGTYVPFSSLIF